MAKMEYTAECLCGGKVVVVFKKPTRFQPAISRNLCRGCGSEFMFSFSVEYNNGQRAYVPKHEVILVTPQLRAAINEKKPKVKNEQKEASP